MKLLNEIGDVTYFEFCQQEYYALMVVKKLKKHEYSFSKSFKLYLEYVGGESLLEIQKEGMPKQLSEQDALMRCLMSDGNKDNTVSEIKKSFYEAVNCPVLIDAGLL